MNGRAGSKSSVVCSNNLISSRIDCKPRLEKFCTWSGFVIRQKDGSVRLFNSDGISFLRCRNTLT